MVRFLSFILCASAANKAGGAQAQVLTKDETVTAPECAPASVPLQSLTLSPSITELTRKLEAFSGTHDVDPILALLDAAAEEDGLTLLDNLAVSQFYAAAYVAQNKPKEALPHLERILVDGCALMNQEQYRQVILSLGQLYISLGNQEAAEGARPLLLKGIAYMEHILGDIPAAHPTNYRMISAAYLQVDPPDFKKVAEWHERAITAAQYRGETVGIGEYKSLVGYYFQLGDFAKAQPALEYLAGTYDDPNAWTQLAFVYGQLGLENDRRMALGVAFSKGMLKTADDHKALIDLHIAAGDPISAEEVFDGAREEGLFRKGSQLSDLLIGISVTTAEDDTPLDRGSSALFRTQPQWPIEAQMEGISGCVEYLFTISESGIPVDVGIIESSDQMFERFGQRAIEMFKYQPRTTAGWAVPDPDQTIRLVWQLEGEPLPDHAACRD